MTTKTYLPLIGSGPAIVPQGDEAASELFGFLTHHPEQRRPTLTWHDLLSRVAHYRCTDMAERDYFDHVDPEGRGPNWHVRDFGYKLPAYYHPSDDINTIESIAAYGSPRDVWTVLLNSESHRIHLLGLNSFYAAQTMCGIGHAYVEGSRWGHYYSIISCPPEEPSA